MQTSDAAGAVCASVDICLDFSGDDTVCDEIIFFTVMVAAAVPTNSMTTRMLHPITRILRLYLSITIFHLMKLTPLPSEVS